jgi:hypothetical protein
MRSFVDYIFEKVYKITPAEQEQVDKLVDKYKKLFFKDSTTAFKIHAQTPQVYFKKLLNEKDPNNLFLGSIKYLDLQDGKPKKVKIFVNFEKGSTSKGEYYDEDKEIILYFYGLEYNNRIVRDTLTHELLHAKQQYKKTGTKYKEAIKPRVLPDGTKTFRSNRAYYYDPVEIPVYTSLIVRNILSNYKKSDRLEKRILKEYIADFIKRGAKLNPDDERAPVFLLDKADFLKYIYRNRKHKNYKKNYHNFLKKLYWAYSKMK